MRQEEQYLFFQGVYVVLFLCVQGPGTLQWSSLLLHHFTESLHLFCSVGQIFLKQLQLWQTHTLV